MLIAALRKLTVVGAIALMGTSAARAETTITKFKSNGSLATVQTNDGNTQIDLTVTQNDTSNTDPVTMLFINSQNCDANFCHGLIAFGSIPTRDFKAELNNAKVNTNLATNSGFTMFTIDQDLNTGETTQTPITPSGVVNIEWHAIPRQWTQFTGTSTTVSGGFATRSSGTQTSTRANVSGSFRGLNLSGPVGQVGSNKQSTFTMVKN